jgi:hypothetical protein
MQRIRRALAPVLVAAAALSAAYAVRSALACPLFLQPQTLHGLYKQSTRVVVARVGRTEVVRTQGTVALVRTALSVSEDVKGAGERFVNLYRLEVVTDGSAGPPIIALPGPLGGAPEAAEPLYKEGERRLLFLEPRAGGDGYEVNYERFGVKALADDALKVYVERMKELAAITRQEPEDKAALAEWLVRCAEEPATRWEGAFELRQSALAHMIREAREAEAGEEVSDEGEEESAEDEEAEADEAGEAAEESEQPSEAPAESEGQEAPTADGGTVSKLSQLEAASKTAAANVAAGGDALLRRSELRFTPPDPSLAPLLTDAQKRRLADALFGAREMGEGEGALLQLVSDFGDPRFPGFVLAQLHRVEDDPPNEADVWLRTLAESLGNKELIEEAADFSTSLVREVPDEERPTDADESAAVQPKPPETPEAREAAFNAALERSRSRRSAALKAIVARLEQFIATGAPPPKPAEAAAAK